MGAAAPRPRWTPPSSPPAGGSGWRALAGSFRFAWAGVVGTALHQRNMRLHLAAATAVAALGSGVALSAPSQLALLLSVFLVLAAEVANSGLEALVDLVTSERDERARAAKDAGAGAVLLLAAGSVAVLAVVVVGEAPVLLAGRAGLLRQASLGVPLVAVESALLAPRRRPPAADFALAVAGAALLGALLPGVACWPFAALAVALLSLGASVAAARRRAAASR